MVICLSVNFEIAERRMCYIEICMLNIVTFFEGLHFFFCKGVPLCFLARSLANARRCAAVGEIACFVSNFGRDWTHTVNIARSTVNAALPAFMRLVFRHKPQARLTGTMAFSLSHIHLERHSYSCTSLWCHSASVVGVRGSNCTIASTSSSCPTKVA